MGAALCQCMYNTLISKGLLLKEERQELLFDPTDEAPDPRISVLLTPSIGSFWGRRKTIRYADMFCGIGGFHTAADGLGLECVFACDIDEDCRTIYQHNYRLKPESDICRLDISAIPEHDILCAGFPCQPFSIIGNGGGFADARGTLFFELARIIDARRPAAFVLENVKQIATHNRRKTLARILQILRELGYTVDYRILNALHFGVPQKRERIIIVGFRGKVAGFTWPTGKLPMKPLNEILEPEPEDHHYVSDRIRRKRHSLHKAKVKPSIWHENKSGNISSYPYSCALRAGASYNYLLVNGERRLTPREMLRLQGFPESFKIVGSDRQIRKQAGNSVPVPMVRAVLERVLNVQRAEAEGPIKAA
jgi:DNA (cytosine-5)-methyltransferase 1